MNLNNGVVDGIRRIGGRFRDITVDGGLPGAPMGLRLRGATASGPPTTGTWRPGDTIQDRNGAWWICTAAGTPGTWVSAAQYAPEWAPVDSSYVAATCSPDVTNGTSGFQGASGDLYLVKLPIRYPCTITYLDTAEASSGGSITYLNLGLVNPVTGNVVTTGTATTSGSAFPATFTMGQATSWTPALQPYVAILCVATTVPRIAGTVGALAGALNANLSAASYRFAINGTGLSTLPSSVTFSSNTGPGNINLPMILAR
jgi:hypothetical protein